jgi:CBS domain-containing protein
VTPTATLSRTAHDWRRVEPSKVLASLPRQRSADSVGAVESPIEDPSGPAQRVTARLAALGSLADQGGGLGVFRWRPRRHRDPAGHLPGVRHAETFSVRIGDSQRIPAQRIPLQRIPAERIAVQTRSRRRVLSTTMRIRRPRLTVEVTADDSRPPTGPTARDVMNCAPERVRHTDTLNEVARKMRKLLVAFLPVCGEQDELHGIIALDHLEPILEGAGDPKKVADVLPGHPPLTVSVDDPVEHVSHLMAQHRVWMVPVVDGRRLVGVIHYRHQLWPLPSSASE